MMTLLLFLVILFFCDFFPTHCWFFGLRKNIRGPSSSLNFNRKWFRSLAAIEGDASTFTTISEKETAESANASVSEEQQYAIRILQSANEVSRETWNALVGADACPFLYYDWINLLEECGCASAEQGWQPLHVVVVRNESTTSSSIKNASIAAIIPLYAKYHSYGEFIFDQSWAQFAQMQLGIKYYPKLLAAIPFTPAAGPRVLMNTNPASGGLDAVNQRRVGHIASSFLKQFALMNDITSANANFITAEQVPYFVNNGYDLRQTIQYRWHNQNPITNTSFHDFDDYLNCFKSKRRIKIRSERKKVYHDQNIHLEVIRGDDEMKATPELYETMFQLYTTTVDKMWGSRYLTQNFFQKLSKAPKEFRKNILFIVAYNKEGRIIAGTINTISKTHFYGRYWGAFEFVNHLHFEVCYYKAIEYCIEQGIEFMEPGAGGGEFKFLRGFDPYIINSVHWFRSAQLTEAVENFLIQERLQNQGITEYLVENSKLKKT